MAVSSPGMTSADSFESQHPSLGRDIVGGVRRAGRPRQRERGRAVRRARETGDGGRLEAAGEAEKVIGAGRAGRRTAGTVSLTGAAAAAAARSAARAWRCRVTPCSRAGAGRAAREGLHLLQWPGLLRREQDHRVATRDIGAHGEVSRCIDTDAARRGEPHGGGDDRAQPAAAGGSHLRTTCGHWHRSAGRFPGAGDRSGRRVPPRARLVGGHESGRGIREGLSRLAETSILDRYS